LRLVRRLENGAVEADPIFACAVVRPRDAVSPYSNHAVEETLLAIRPIPRQRPLLFVISVAILVTTLLNLITGGGRTGVGVTIIGHA
jgi:hypothetical protein